MTQPVQEPTQGRVDQGQEFRTRQLFRRPAPISPTLRQTGYTITYGDGNTPLPTDPDLYITAPIAMTRDIVGNGTPPWYVYDPSANVNTPSSSLDIWITISRLRNCTDVDLIAFMVIEAGECTTRTDTSGLYGVVPYISLEDQDATPNYDALVVQILVPGTDATGLCVNIPIGVEQPLGSGEHIP